MFSQWSAIYADNIEKHLRTFPSAESILRPSSAAFCKGSKRSLKTPQSVSALICLCKWSAEDFLSLGETSNSAKRRIAKDPGLLRRSAGRFTRVKYTGNPFLSPERLLWWVWSNIPMTWTIVAPDGSVSYNQLVSGPWKEIEKLYLNVPPPVCCMHLCIPQQKNEGYTRTHPVLPVRPAAQVHRM